MFQSVKLICGQILWLALLCGSALAQEQPDSTMEQPKGASFAIAQKALQQMPESFRRVIARNMNRLRDGTDEARGQTFERSTLEEDTLLRAVATVSRLQAQPKFQEAARDFGSIAQMVLLLNLPEADSDKLRALSEVIARNSTTFRVVVYDEGEIAASREGMEGFLSSLRQRRTSLSERFAEIELKRSQSSSSGSIDPRSALYGIAALVYSHSINDTARTWLWIWRSANGDMSRLPSLVQP